ncbi:hypothetical protein R1flu_011271 [Riccia fluitans]|uniref:Uncharacterized protein n=1 Tax=Riccia fluitans TaxID=41844 RepID=A0ABD1Z9V1_9MARC
MAVNRQSTSLYYDGYDPNWIIGTGKPAPVYPPPHAVGTNRKIAAVLPVQANEFVLPVKAHGAHDNFHGGKGKKIQAPAAHLGQPPMVGKVNMGPVAHAHLTGAGALKPAPNSHLGNPNPYAQAPRATVAQGPVPLAHHSQASAPVPLVHTVHVQKPVAQAPVTALVIPPAGGPPRISAPGVGEVPVNAIIKVVMWVPICCEACDGKWKDQLSDLSGFQGYDFERDLERLTVFGQISPSDVLATMKKIIPGTQMWRR